MGDCALDAFIAALPDISFHSHLKEIGRENAKIKIDFLEKRLQNYSGGSEFFSRDISNFIHGMRSGTELPEAGIPSELLYNLPFDVALKTLKLIVLRYGQLLGVWLDLIRFAQDWSCTIIK